MIISIGNDHAGTDYKKAIVAHLESKGFTVHNYGTDTSDSVDYPDFVHPVAEDVSLEKVNFGILICGSANGVAMTANKHQKVRAGICWTKEITELTRQHMSVDPHWFSTLFGWYVFASMFVSGITTIALITIYLKSKGYLEFVNDSHIHDLAKFMFGISIFWTYLWFSQFMLIWYSNIPEEVTYFISRINDYKLPFFGMLVMNFIFPLLVLMNSDYKRVNWFVVMAGIIILLGHYIDVFNMIMPATVADRWFIGFPEIGAVLLFAGLFIFIVFNALTKAPLLAKGNPFIKESEHFHY